MRNEIQPPHIISFNATTTDITLTVNSDTKSLGLGPVQDNCSDWMPKIIYTITEMYEPTTIHITVRDVNGMEYLDNTYSFQQALTSRETKKKFQQLIDETDDDDDDDDDYYEPYEIWACFLSNILSRSFQSLRKTIKLLERLELIKDKECPVYHTALKSTCYVLKKCQHMISKEAWDKIEASVDGNRKPCPLCRSPHHYGEVESL